MLASPLLHNARCRERGGNNLKVDSRNSALVPKPVRETSAGQDCAARDIAGAGHRRPAVSRELDFEPMVAPAKKNGRSDRIRTCDVLLPKQVL